MSYHYSFASDDYIRDLVNRARRANITFTVGGLIRIKRHGWAKGKRTVVIQDFQEFPSSLRSMKHIVQNAFARAGLDRAIRLEFGRFHAWLLSSSIDTEKKQIEAESRVLGLAGRLSGVRTENLVSVRNGLFGEELRRSVQELIEERRWGAACTKIVFRLNPGIVNEHARVLEYVPAILHQEELLRKIWEYRLQEGQALREGTIGLARLYDQIGTDELRIGELLEWLDGLLPGLERPWHYRLRMVRADLRGTRKALARGYKAKTATGELKSAQYHLREYNKWLLAGEADVQSSRQRVMQFQGVA